ncbi:MAG: four helix bundle protein [Phycisphaeraceae bacterium]|nr:four helix bundle protein [Phycisphaeraceae bacterium]
MDRRDYRRLDVWHKAMELVEAIYSLTRKLPAEERFGLTSQLQRAAVSIPANIAEGYGRTHRGDYLHHLSMARGSLMELETLLIVAVKVKLLTRDTVKPTWKQCQQTSRMLTQLIRALKTNEKSTTNES